MYNVFVKMCQFAWRSTVKAIKNVRLNGTLTDITVDAGKIISIGRTDVCGVDFGGARIYPGLIDTHSHGCIGQDTMGGDLSAMADFQLAHGTTTWYPTTMTASEEDIIRTTSQNIDISHGASIPGFHLEGPFINKKYKGAQNGEFIIPPSSAFFGKCKNVKKVTLAPECAGAIEFIRECPATVSLGHTDCDYEVASAAFEAGARSLTHTFNAMPGIHHRAPGPIGAGCERDDVYAELICDGRHVHAAAVKMLIKLFGEDRIILISDSMLAVGMPDGEYIFGGQPVVVKDGVAMTQDGRLAGSTATLFDCVRTAVSFGIPEDIAVKMASENPARLMGLNKGRIEVGYDADFIIVDDDFGLIRAIARGEF